jgi:hypothetical protein
MPVWEDNDTWVGDLVQAIRRSKNLGIPDQHGPLEAHIYVDDILASAVEKQNILRHLAATIEAIFTVCGCPMIEVHQCPLSLDKWEDVVVGSVQTVLGLTVDTNTLTVGITPKYRGQVRNFLGIAGKLKMSLDFFQQIWV